MVNYMCVCVYNNYGRDEFFNIKLSPINKLNCDPSKGVQP